MTEDAVQLDVAINFDINIDELFFHYKQMDQIVAFTSTLRLCF